MASLNRVQLIGNLGRDPEIKSFQNGGRVCNFSVACSESWKDRHSGERKEKTEWINVAIFSDGLIGVCEKYLRKGSKVFVEGKMQTRKWQDRDGNDRYTTEVVIQGFGGQLILLGEKNGGSGGGQRSGGSQTGGGSDSGGNAGAGEWGNTGGGASAGHDWADDLDDDIPF
jgi:single-strand DNA-binding protein